MIVAWAVLSACWVLGWAWYYHLPSCGEVHAGEGTDIGWHCHERLGLGGDSEVIPALVMAAVIVGVPIATFFTALAIRFLLSQDRRSD